MKIPRKSTDLKAAPDQAHVELARFYRKMNRVRKIGLAGIYALFLVSITATASAGVYFGAALLTVLVGIVLYVGIKDVQALDRWADWLEKGY